MTTETISSFQADASDALPAPRRQVESARRPWIRTLVKDAVLVVMGLSLAELTLRVVAPEYGHDFYDRQLTASHPVIFNSDGYRGPAVPKAKASGELRILGLGDSTTFGTGVGVEDTWPLQLRDMLAAHSKRPISAMNVGLQGTTLADLCHGYEERWADYHPDVVIALVSGNMVSFAWMQRNQAPKTPPYVFPEHQAASGGLKTKLSHAYGRLCLPHFISINMQRALYWAGVLDYRIVDPKQPFGALLAYGWVQPDLPNAEIQDAWQVMRREVEHLHEATSKRGAKLIVAFSPCRFDMSNSVFDDEKNLPRERLTIDPDKRLRSICQEDGITFVDVPPALRSARARLTEERGHTAPMYIMFDYNHLDHDGHHAVAAAMMPAVEQVQSAAVQRSED
jgi:lysophospholipase L1-like esterase